MKKSARFIIAGALAIFTALEAGAQCTPDTENCIDTGDPGEICPRKLPVDTLNVYCDTSFTVIPPGSYDIGSGNLISIEFIMVDSVLNLPPGIGYQASADTLYPDMAYCVQIFGTPTQTGEFPLKIYVSAYVLFMGDYLRYQFMDDTSVVMTVVGPTGYNPYQVSDFQVFPNVPNPFYETTSLGFYTPFDDRIELKVYNILGELMHQEEMGASPGEHRFRFDGGELLPGTYFYRVRNRDRFYTGKFIKSR